MQSPPRGTELAQRDTVRKSQIDTIWPVTIDAIAKRHVVPAPTMPMSGSNHVVPNRSQPRPRGS